MQLKLGYSTGAVQPKLDLNQRIDIIYLVSREAIELGLTRAERIDEQISYDNIARINEFKYRSIHAPVKFVDDWVRYPSEQGDKIIATLLDLSEKISAHTIVFHPDLVDDFKVLENTFSGKLAFENMDNNKDFGKNIEDMTKVFELAPNASWVCDVNHIFTIDKTMKLSTELHQEFKSRLIHYHLSAFGGFHDLFTNTHEDIIMDGLLDLSKPIIHEGSATKESLASLVNEDKYVKNYLANRK